MTKEKKPRILLWDIEASDLAANFGFVFCIGYKWLGESKVNLISIRDFKNFKKDVTDDSEVLKAFAKVLAEADLQVTWYGMRFDFPFINTRAMMQGLPPMPIVPHLDGWRVAKYKLKFNSNRLDAVSKAIPCGIESKRELKTSLDCRHWVRAKAGYSDALNYVDDHCRADIRVLEKVYLELRPFFGTEVPNLSKIGNTLEEGCQGCGSLRIQSRGYFLTARGNKRRFQCQDCDRWFSLPVKIKID